MPLFNNVTRMGSPFKSYPTNNISSSVNTTQLKSPVKFKEYYLFLVGSKTTEKTNLPSIISDSVLSEAQSQKFIDQVKKTNFEKNSKVFCAAEILNEKLDKTSGKKLKAISVVNCQDLAANSVEKVLSLIAESCPNLNTLTLKDWGTLAIDLCNEGGPNMLGEFDRLSNLSFFTSVQEISFFHCSNDSFQFLMKFCSYFTNLTKLEINGNAPLTSKEIDELKSICKNLKEVVTSN